MLEWKVIEAFHAKQQAPLNPSSLQNFSDEQFENLIFKFPAIAEG